MRVGPQDAAYRSHEIDSLLTTHNCSTIDPSAGQQRRDKPGAPSYGEAASRLEEILAKIEEGQVDIDELSGLVREAASP